MYTDLTPCCATSVGDFNADGFEDLFSPNRSTVYLGTASGTFIPLSTGSSIDSTNVLADVNGDGKTDAVVASSVAGSQLLLSNGSSYTSYALTGIPTGIMPADVNGDGRQDLIQCKGSSGFDYLLSQGKSFSSATNVPTTVAANYCVVGDFNGDGKADVAVQSSSGSAFYVYYAKGSGFTAGPSQTVTGQLITTADFNGDGRADVVSKSSNARYKRETNGEWPDLVTQTESVLGGTTTVDYTPSSAWNTTPGTLMPFVLPTVETVTVDDGRGTTAATAYAYRGGKIDSVERRFLGFAGLNATLPCNSTETACPSVDVTFSQDLAAVGTPTIVDQRDGSGVSLRTTTTTVTANNFSAPFTALLTATEEVDRDNGATRARRTERTYDSYGQVAVKSEFGLADYAGDERTTVTKRYPETALYVVDRPAETTIYQGVDGAGTMLARSRVLYDGATGFTTPPTKGDPTKTQRWLDTTSSFVEASATYDTAGNLLTKTDELGHTTSYQYDATYSLFPIKVTNALSQETDQTWNLTCAKPDTTTDPNGLDTSSDYDTFCREIRRDLPTGDYRAFSFVSIGEGILDQRRSSLDLVPSYPIGAAE